jgi:hypothetical protein
LFLFFAFTVFLCGQKEKTKTISGSRYEDLVGLFNDWRDFQAPVMKPVM